MAHKKKHFAKSLNIGKIEKLLFFFLKLRNEMWSSIWFKNSKIYLLLSILKNGTK